MNYYNEHDQKAAAWLRELIAAGHIPPGDVDTRSITEVSPHELTRYTQCHFFAGIGGWSLALELAGWPPTRPVWTGSCPCQPFSAAGQGKGGSDDRHIWPVFHRLVSQLKPERIFGEQVAQAIGFNWLDGVSADLEADGYTVGAAVLGAHSVGAPHIRQRLFWVADSNRGRCEQRDPRQRAIPIPATNGATGRLADMQREGLEGFAGNGNGGNQPGRIEADAPRHAAKGGATGGMGDPELHGRNATPIRRCPEQGPSEGRVRQHQGPNPHFWDHFNTILCRDGKTRRFEPEPQQMVDGVSSLLDALRTAGASQEQIETALATFPLAASLPGRVGLLRGYGNAIVPQVAAEFVMACDEILGSAISRDAIMPV